MQIFLSNLNIAGMKGHTGAIQAFLILISVSND